MIPFSLRSERESYIVRPVLQKFCKEHGLKTTENRDNLLNNVLEYATQSDDNKSYVANWVDNILKQGIKHIYLRKIYSKTNELIMLQNENLCQKILQEAFADCPMKPIIFSETTENLIMKNYKCKIEDGIVVSISFTFSQLLLENKNFDGTADRIIYPIFVDIDLVNDYVIGKAKSKSNIYYCNPANTIVETSRVTTEELILKAIDFVVEKTSLVLEDKERSNSGFKNSLYNILKAFTFTPQEIQHKIDEFNEDLDEFIQITFSRLNIDLQTNLEKAKNDLNIFLEKYISINYPDPEIFTRDREAYPIKLMATDSEFTRIEEVSIRKEPLQCKEKFFDNKKSTELERTCDRIALCYNRINPTYFGNIPYIVKLEVKKGYCAVKFESYVEEEDINNVLSRVIIGREL